MSLINFLIDVFAILGFLATSMAIFSYAADYLEKRRERREVSVAEAHEILVRFLFLKKVKFSEVKIANYYNTPVFVVVILRKNWNHAIEQVPGEVDGHRVLLTTPEAEKIMGRNKCQ